MSPKNPSDQTKKRKVPTIRVTGSTVRQQPPKFGVIAVTVSEKGPPQEQAWEKFQRKISELNEALGAFGTVSNVMPRETSEDVSRGLRSGVEYTVSAYIEVEFTPANYGQILEAFVKCGLPISAPRFTYDELAKLTPELLAEAAAAAKANAEGIALGVGGHLGRLASIQIGAPRLLPVYRPISAMDSFISASLSLHKTKSYSRLLDEEKLETYDTEVQVTVEYEIIENSTVGEVA